MLIAKKKKQRGGERPQLVQLRPSNTPLRRLRIGDKEYYVKDVRAVSENAVVVELEDGTLQIIPIAPGTKVEIT